MTLRPANAADLPFLQDVYRKSRESELALLPWSDAQKEAFCAMQFVAQDRGYRGAYPDGEFLLVEMDGEPIGRLYRAATPASFHLIDITLRPEWRNRGIGTQLLRETMSLAAATGLPVQLHVDKSNPARRLYARLGFREVGDAGLYLRLEWRGAT